MRKLPIALTIIVAIIVSSCSNNAPEYANSIPDDAFAVMTIHPKQIYDKGQINTFEKITEEIDDELLKEIVKDPSKAGIVLNEYAYGFAFMLFDDPALGMVAGIQDAGKFKKFIEAAIDEDINFISEGELTMIAKDHSEAGMAWNNDQVIFLTVPDVKLDAEAMKSELSKLFVLEKEEAITSVVDFNDFSGKMEDMNLWFSSNEMSTILEKIGKIKNMDMDMNLPFDLDNNYGQVFVEFADGAMYIHSETNLSDDVEKAKDLMIGQEELNKDLLKIAPGNDLLMAAAYSVNFEKMTKIMKNFMPPEAEGMSGQIEKATGVPGNEILEALTGDFVLAVNGAPEGAAIPVEILIGLGLNDETLQDKLMETAGNKAAVEKDGDFFMINANGIELYSGIINGIWVITNVSGYKDAITKNGLDKTLADSKFKDFAGGSMGMYLNLDLTSYPAAIQAMLAQGGAPEELELLTESFLFMGIEAGNTEADAIVKTAKQNENSLYTLLKFSESVD